VHYLLFYDTVGDYQERRKPFRAAHLRYAQEAVQKHGARRGAWLALKRLGRCRPFVKGGFDPVPEPEEL